ncbi:MAG: AMP-binding protein [Woeseiaceae bacterium]|nr:AMP-binding protein [Woeseiaceae bacterium]
MVWFAPTPQLIPDLIALNSHWLRDKPAVIVDDTVHSWTAFGRGTSRVANALLERGLVQGDRVIVLMHNSLAMAEAIFGIMRAGLVVVPLNVAVADSAVAGMIANCGARAIIASDEHMQRITDLASGLSGEVRSRLIGLRPVLPGWQDYDEMREAAPDVLATIPIKPEDPCNIIYSSGTTGVPKGIVHSHACRSFWASDLAVALRYHSGARTLCNLGLYSNISWVAMLATLFAGGTLVIQRRFEVKDCLQAIQDHGITHAAMVPLQYQRLLEYDDFDDFDLSSLDATMCCGSPLSVVHKRAIMERLPGDFIELYGLTEGLVTILPPEDMQVKIESVGRPAPGQHMAIIDDGDQVVANGEAGEIVGYSRLMMSGYHGNDTESEAATWLHPSGARWLRTGDIGRIDDDGFLYLVDRKKDLIISGGQNIYPADIEAVLIRHKDVSEVAVIGVASKRWGETPLALVVARQGARADAEELAAWTNGQLGKQQRIAAVRFLAQLPRNPNGKVLKRELRKQFATLTF